jgi:hypothetical protein
MTIYPAMSNRIAVLKRERCTSKMELSLIISMTVIIRVKHSSMYSNICVVHREEGLDRPLGLSHPSVTATLQRTYENPCITGRN